MDYLIAISDYVKETVIQKYNITNKKISVINRGIDTEYFNQPINKTYKEDFFFGKAVIDKASLDIINGSIIDYKKEMIELGYIKN